MHSTLQEYLDTVCVTLFADVEVRISRVCLTYLIFNVFKEGPCEDIEAMDDHLQDYPLALYALSYWGDHLSGDPEREVTDLVLRFLRNARKVSSATGRARERSECRIRIGWDSAVYHRKMWK